MSVPSASNDAPRYFRDQPRHYAPHGQAAPPLGQQHFAPQPPTRPGLPGLLGHPRALLVLLGSFVAAAIALVALPPLFAAIWPGAAGTTMSTIPGLVDTGLAQLWSQSGGAPAADGVTLPADLAAAAAFWQGFHVAKALAAAVLLAAWFGLGGLLWGRFATSPSGARRFGLGVLGVLGSGIGPFALVLLLANLQGTIAPLSSALSLLPENGAAAAAVAGIRAELEAGTPSAATTVLVDDFQRYHAAMAVASLAAVLGLIALTLIAWIARTRIASRARRGEIPAAVATRVRALLALTGLALPVLAGVIGIITLANFSSVEESTRALALFFDGSGM